MLAQNERESGERGFVVDPAEVLPIRARSFAALRLAQDDVRRCSWLRLAMVPLAGTLASSFCRVYDRDRRWRTGVSALQE